MKQINFITGGPLAAGGPGQLPRLPPLNLTLEQGLQTTAREAISPDRIYNVDETVVTTVQIPKKIVTTAGTKSVGSITSRERGERRGGSSP